MAALRANLLPKLRSMPSIKLTKSDSTTLGYADDDGGIKYTSLRDIIAFPIPTAAYAGRDGDGGGVEPAANISIRNQLVKHAASAYLQSTAILASRERNCLVGLCGNNDDSMRSCWNLYVEDPARAFFRSLWEFLGGVVDEIRRIAILR